MIARKNHGFAADEEALDAQWEALFEQVNNLFDEYDRKNEAVNEAIRNKEAAAADGASIIVKDSGLVINLDFDGVKLAPGQVMSLS